jgi:hypothetical protein
VEHDRVGRLTFAEPVMEELAQEKGGRTQGTCHSVLPFFERQIGEQGRGRRIERPNDRQVEPTEIVEDLRQDLFRRLAESGMNGAGARGCQCIAQLFAARTSVIANEHSSTVELAH